MFVTMLSVLFHYTYFFVLSSFHSVFSSHHFTLAIFKASPPPAVVSANTGTSLSSPTVPAAVSSKNRLTSSQSGGLCGSGSLFSIGVAGGTVPKQKQQKEEQIVGISRAQRQLCPPTRYSGSDSGNGNRNNGSNSLVSCYGRETSPQIFCFKNFLNQPSSTSSPVAVTAVPAPFAVHKNQQNIGSFEKCATTDLLNCGKANNNNNNCLSTSGARQQSENQYLPNSELICENSQRHRRLDSSEYRKSNTSTNNSNHKSKSQKCERISAGAEFGAGTGGAEQLPSTRKTAVTLTTATTVTIPPSPNSNNNNNNNNSSNDYECEGHQRQIAVAQPPPPQQRRTSDNSSVRNLFYLNKKIDSRNTQSYGRGSHKNKLLLIAAGPSDGHNGRRVESGETGSSDDASTSSKCRIVKNRFRLLDEGNLKCINRIKCMWLWSGKSIAVAKYTVNLK